MSKKIEGTAGRSDGNSHGSDADAEPPFLKEAAAATATALLALAQYQFRRPSDKIPPEYLEKRDGEIQKKTKLPEMSAWPVRFSFSIPASYS